MSKTYLPYDPDQQLLLPAALHPGLFCEWLPPDHLAYFISDVVDQLDLSAITVRYEEERRGGAGRLAEIILIIASLAGRTNSAAARTAATA